MTTPLTHRQIARKRARAWQASAIALLVAAGAVAFVPAGSLLAPKTVRIDTTPPEAPAPETIRPVDETDLLAAANILKIATNWKPPESNVEPPEDTPPVTEDPVATAPAVPVATGQWFYIGSIITPKSRRAMVKVDESQHMLTVGEQLGTTKVVGIEPESITVEANGQTRQIALQTRTLDWPTEGPKRPVAFRTPPMNPANPAANAAAMAAARKGNPAQTFDQARAQALAEQARRAQLPVPPPPMPAMPQAMSQDALRKMLADSGMSPDQKMQYLEQLGITPGMSTERAMSVLNNSGVQVTDDLVQAIKLNQDKRAPQEQPDTSPEAEEARLIQALSDEERNKLAEMSEDERRQFLENHKHNDHRKSK